VFRIDRDRLILQPVKSYDPPRNAPFVFPLLEEIAVAPRHDALPHHTICSRGALQDKKIGFDRGTRGIEKLDEDVADEMNIARVRLEYAGDPLEKTIDRPGISTVLVGRIRPISAAQRRFIGTIDAATVLSVFRTLSAPPLIYAMKNDAGRLPSP
jgi:hypothetical protein